MITTLWILTPALGQGLDAHTFDVLNTSADPRGGLRLVEGGQGETGLVGGLFLDLAHQPLVERLPGGPDPVLKDLFTGTVVVSGAPGRRARLEAVMPVHLYGVGPTGGFTAAGDLRLGTVISVVPQQRAAPGLSIQGSLWVPTGDTDRYLGHPTMSGGGLVALSQRWGSVGWTLDAGIRWSPDAKVRAQPVGPGPVGGIGLHLAASSSVTILAEVAAEGTGGFALDTVPLESSLGLRVRGRRGRWWTLAAGAGLTDAPGVPAWRLVLGGGLGRPVDPVLVVAAAPTAPPAVPDLPAVVEVRVSQPEPILAELVEDRIVLHEQIFFLEGQAGLHPRSGPVLDAVLGVLRQNPDVTYLLIEGHTNHHGSGSVNRRLSNARAEAVADWLVRRGVPRRRLITEGYGSERPLLGPDEPNAATVNRRVEFVVVRPDEDETDAVVPDVVELDGWGGVP